MKWKPLAKGVYACHTGTTYAAVRRIKKNQWNLLLSATVADRAVRHGSDHPTMAEAIAKATHLIGGKQ
jgi:hypothetical protein